MHIIQQQQVNHSFIFPSATSWDFLIDSLVSQQLNEIETNQENSKTGTLPIPSDYIV